ncbi:MAG TPA: L-serine ammonia-lyase [Bacteroidales bacterium]|nr:L-serine ammonia-lyase [Bacteroidales bacterium]
MKTIKELFKIGHGPSSSHTMGPRRAAEQFLSKNPTADGFRVTLYGSLAATGAGHLTDTILLATFHPLPLDIIWKPDIELPLHPNGMEFEALKTGYSIAAWRVYSIGGGNLMEEGETNNLSENVYKLHTMHDILLWCQAQEKSMWEYVKEYDYPDIFDYLGKVWGVMKDAIESGLEQEGSLPGGLNLVRRAPQYYTKSKTFSDLLKRTGYTFAYALAVAEENAAGGRIVTAPTCGSAGVLPGVLYSLQKTYKLSDTRIIRGLATAGLIGNLIRTNASISGAEVGCQGEIGAACSMAAGAAVQLLGGSVLQVEYAAEMGMEHHLGLTCDPVNGLVQIPCIERNAMAAVRALECATYSLLSDGKHRITFDEVIKTMKQTGLDLKASYRETSQGGLALNYSGLTR